MTRTHAAAAPCLLQRTFPECDDCPYFRAKDVAIALVAFTMINAMRLSVIYVVAWCVLANVLFATIF